MSVKAAPRHSALPFYSGRLAPLLSRQELPPRRRRGLAPARSPPAPAGRWPGGRREPQRREPGAPRAWRPCGREGALGRGLPGAAGGGGAAPGLAGAAGPAPGASLGGLPQRLAAGR